MADLRQLSTTRAMAKLAVALLMLSALALNGCAALGVAAHALPPPKIKPAYTGLVGQTAAVMVWADSGLRMDYNTLQIDVARVVQSKLTNDGKKKNFSELKDLSWPIDPMSIIKYQRDYPQVNNAPITEVAPKFGVSRLIYIQIDSLSTRSEASVDLFKGTMTGSLTVLEIADGKAKVVYQDSNIRATFPKKGPEAGITNSDDFRMYLGAISMFTTEIANRFLPHEQEE